MNRNISRESVTTDDGYLSDNVGKSPTKPVNFEKENVEFKEKYLVEKLLNNSANGVIYTGLLLFYNYGSLLILYSYRNTKA